MNPWTYKGQTFDPSEPVDPKICQGFIYRIRNKADGRIYVGRKWTVFRSTKTVKGKKKKVLSESDWRTYYGSNTELQADVEKLGSDNFEREILCFVPSKGVGNYLEAKYIMIEDAILRGDAYNAWISLKVTRKHVQRYAKEMLDGKMSDRIFENLQQVKKV